MMRHSFMIGAQILNILEVWGLHFCKFFNWNFVKLLDAAKPSTLSVFPGSNFFGKTPLFFRYSGVNAANAVNLQAKRR